jgi:hypothetical protein
MARCGQSRPLRGRPEVRRHVRLSGTRGWRAGGFRSWVLYGLSGLKGSVRQSRRIIASSLSTCVITGQPNGPMSRRIAREGDTCSGRRAAERSFWGVRQALCGLRSSLDRTGEVASGDAPPGVLWSSLGTASDGTDRVRSSDSLVRWAWGGRCGLRPFDLLEEPRPAA